MCSREELAADLERYRWGQCVHCDVAILKAEQWELGYCCFSCDNQIRQAVSFQYRQNPRLFIWGVVSTETAH